MGEQECCLVTVTSESYLPGTMVMIHTFLKYNPWFEGEIVIIHDSLPARLQNLTDCFKKVTFLQVEDALKEKINRLCKDVPRLNLGARKRRFYSLELFRLSGYRKVLFCDSDILFLDTIYPLFDAPYESNEYGEDNRLLAGGDLHYFTGEAVDEETFLPKEKGTIKQTFNAGFLVIDSSYLTPQHYRSLTDLLDSGLWSKIEAPRTDQVIFNLYFRDNWRLLSARYNYLVAHADVIPGKEDVPIKEIKVLHFNGKAKPWDILSVLHAVPGDALLFRFVKMWHNEYLEFLPQYHLRSRFKGNTGLVHKQETGK